MINTEKYIKRTFNMTLIPTILKINSKYRKFIYGFVNLIYFGSLFCNLFYPSYYINQPLIWTIDLALSFIVYNIMYKLKEQTNIFLLDSNTDTTFQHQKERPFVESIEISKLDNLISLLFYFAYMIYWLYFAIFMLYIHREPKILIQLGNILMFGPWFLLFSTLSCLFYYICVKLIKRSKSIKQFLKDIKHNKPTLENFKNKYLFEYHKTKIFSRKWNLVIHIGLFLIVFHVLVDFITFVVKKEYYAIPGFVVKLTSLFWYINSICRLNNYDYLIIKYINKHQIIDKENIDIVSSFINSRPLGIHFYGFKINGIFITRTIIFIINFIFPIVCGLFVNNMFD